MYPDSPKLTLFSILPTGFIIAAIPLFADRTTYFPVSIALKILWIKCCLGPMELPNQPSSEILIIRSKSDVLNNFPDK